MLSSIILSLVVNTSPAPAVDQDALTIEQTARKVKTIRMSEDFEMQRSARKVKTIRMSEDFEMQRSARKVKTIRR